MAPKKDLATPTYVANDSQMYQRCAKRKHRAKHNLNNKRSARECDSNYLNDACRMRMVKTPASGAKKATSGKVLRWLGASTAV